MSELRDFVADLLERRGAAVEFMDPDGLEVLAPAPLQKTMGWPELARLGFHKETQDLKDSGALFGYYQELRDGVAHFLLDKNKSASGSLQFSSTHIYNYAAVSSVLLKYLRLELIHLRYYYEKFLSAQIHGRYPLWNSDDRGKHHVVVCPDD